MVYLLIFILLTGGIFAVVSQLLGLPPASTGRGVKIATHKDHSPMDFVNEYFISPFVKVLSPLVRMAEFKEKRMGIQLARAGISLTPKEYVARSFLMAGAALVLSGLLLSLTMPLWAKLKFWLCLEIRLKTNQLQTKLTNKSWSSLCSNFFY